MEWKTIQFCKLKVGQKFYCGGYKHIKVPVNTGTSCIWFGFNCVEIDKGSLVWLKDDVLTIVKIRRKKRK